MLFFSISGTDVAGIKSPHFVMFCYAICSVLFSIPFFFILILTIRWIYSYRKFGLTIAYRLSALRHGYALLGDEGVKDEVEEFGDRLVNPGYFRVDSPK